MDSTGSNMPMKMVPMNPAMRNSNNGSANATAVFRLRSRSLSVHDGNPHQFAVQLAAFFRDGNHFQDGAGEKSFAIGQALAEPARPAARVRWIARRRPPEFDCRWNGGRRSGFAPAARPRRAACRASGKNAPWQIARSTARRAAFSKSVPPRCAGLFPKQTRCATKIRCRPAPSTMSSPYERTMWLAPMMICVINGSELCMLSKMFWNFGMKKVSSTISTPMASTSRMHG